MSEVRITQDGPRGTVEIDGHDVSRLVRGAEVVVRAGELPRVTLEMVPVRVGDLTVTDAEVVLPDDLIDFLVRLGWKAPR